MKKSFGCQGILQAGKTMALIFDNGARRNILYVQARQTAEEWMEAWTESNIS